MAAVTPDVVNQYITLLQNLYTAVDPEIRTNSPAFRKLVLEPSAYFHAQAKSDIQTLILQITDPEASAAGLTSAQIDDLAAKYGLTRQPAKKATGNFVVSNATFGPFATQFISGKVLYALSGGTILNADNGLRYVTTRSISYDASKVYVADGAGSAKFIIPVAAENTGSLYNMNSAVIFNGEETTPGIDTGTVYLGQGQWVRKNYATVPGTTSSAAPSSNKYPNTNYIIQRLPSAGVSGGAEQETDAALLQRISNQAIPDFLYSVASIRNLIFSNFSFVNHIHVVPTQRRNSSLINKRCGTLDIFVKPKTALQTFLSSPDRSFYYVYPGPTNYDYILNSSSAPGCVEGLGVMIPAFKYVYQRNLANVGLGPPLFGNINAAIWLTGTAHIEYDTPAIDNPPDIIEADLQQIGTPWTRLRISPGIDPDAGIPADLNTSVNQSVYDVPGALQFPGVISTGGPDRPYLNASDAALSGIYMAWRGLPEVKLISDLLRDPLTTPVASDIVVSCARPVYWGGTIQYRGIAQNADSIVRAAFSESVIETGFPADGPVYPGFFLAMSRRLQAAGLTFVGVTAPPTTTHPGQAYYPDIPDNITVTEVS